MTTGTTTEPRIYAACLACYNSGRLVGAWINAAQDADEIRDEIHAMLDGTHAEIMGAHAPDPCPHEEWAIHDHEGLGQVSEYEDIGRISAIGLGVERDGDAFLAWLGLGVEGSEPDDWAEEFADHYRGSFDSAAEFAEDFHDNIGDLSSVPESLRPYIDWDAVARDMRHDSFSFEDDGSGGVFVFWTA